MIHRMDNVLIVVEDLDGAVEFFRNIGMELEGRSTLEGDWAGRVIGVPDARQEIAMLRPPAGGCGVELAKFTTPAAIVPEPEDAPANTLGIRRVMFAVDDIDAVVDRLLDDGAALVGELVQFENVYRLCYVRGPENIIVGLAEQRAEQIQEDA